MIQDLVDLNTVTVGTPFKLQGSSTDLYYFTIFSHNDIIGTYRVYENEGSYTGIFNENTDFINGLQGVASLTSSINPAKIISASNDAMYAIIDNEVHAILESPTGQEISKQSLLAQPQTFSSDEVINVSTGIEFDIPQPATRTTPSYKFLQIGWDETQGNLPWCMAYVTASIMRYKTGEDINSISARSVMESAYPDLSTSVLEKTALSTSKADDYANTHNVNPTYTSSRRTYSQVTSDIKADSPLAFICDNVNTGTKRSHAFVCRGYNDNNGNPFYSIWNPWYSEFERIYTSNNTYVNSQGTATYLWSATMYGWN